MDVVTHHAGDAALEAGLAERVHDLVRGLNPWPSAFFTLEGKRMKLPQYHVVEISGAAHKQTFKVECTIAEWNISAQGSGASRRMGEQAAAAALLEKVKAKNP